MEDAHRPARERTVSQPAPIAAGRAIRRDIFGHLGLSTVSAWSVILTSSKTFVTEWGRSGC